MNFKCDHLFGDLQWAPPANWMAIETIDMHTGGEPLRVITRGVPNLPGGTVLEKRRCFREHYDHIRTALMWEPRGHADMYGAVVTGSADADFDAFFLHNEGYSTMCGHAILALTKLFLETPRAGRMDGEASLAINVPAGRILAQATLHQGAAGNLRFRNVPSFVLLRDATVETPGVGRVTFDVAFGGAFYAIVDAERLGVELSAPNHDRLIDLGRRIKHAVVEGFSIKHPFEEDLSFLYGVIFTGAAQHPAHHSRNVCIFANGELDRSPTGSGVSARAALHVARGELALDETITIESLVGSTMSVRAVDHVNYGPHEAIVPEVGGTAHVTGRHIFYIDPEDPLHSGFLLR